MDNLKWTVAPTEDGLYLVSKPSVGILCAAEKQGNSVYIQPPADDMFRTHKSEQTFWHYYIDQLIRSGFRFLGPLPMEQESSNEQV